MFCFNYSIALSTSSTKPHFDIGIENAEKL